MLIKPSHYDDEGYVIQWARSSIPANSLATVYGLALDCAERKVLGHDVEILITAVDETNTRVRPSLSLIYWYTDITDLLMTIVSVDLDYP